VFGVLYRYPHPDDVSRFIYCGQGARRDRDHRSAKSSFGRRFQKKFPGVELPQPIREVVEVVDQVHLNHLETAWMILYKTLHIFEDGMNLLLPGSTDYQNIGVMGGLVSGPASKRGKIAIFGMTQQDRRAASLKAFETNTKNKSGLFGRTSDQISEDARKGGNVGGPIAGRRHRDNKTGVCGRSPEKRAADGSKGLRALIAMNPEHQKAAGRRGGRMQPHEAKVRGGRLGGLAGSYEDKVRAGRISGQKAVASGQLASALCRRWNINRNKPCVCGQHLLAA